MNWSARGNVLNQYLSNTSIGTTVMHQPNPSVPIPLAQPFSCKAHPGGWAFPLEPGVAFEIKDLEVLRSLIT
jgi:hypothetical protein